MKIEIDTDTGKWTATCPNGGGSASGTLGIAQLPPVTVTANPWPFSTPPNVGTTANFGNPNARGGHAIPGPSTPSTVGPGGGQGGTSGGQTLPAMVGEMFDNAASQPRSCSMNYVGAMAFQGALGTGAATALGGAIIGGGFGGTAGAAVGAALGAPTGPGAVLTAAGGGILGRIGGAWVGGVVGLRIGLTVGYVGGAAWGAIAGCGLR